MSEPPKVPKTPEELIQEFKQIDQEYKRKRREHEREVTAMLQRRRAIIQELINNNGAARPRTHLEVGAMLGLSGGRIGQLVKGAPGYVPRRSTGP